MKKCHASAILETHKQKIVGRSGVRYFSLFGSTARDESGDESDLDIMVEFDGAATSDRYFGLQFYLEDLLGRPIDLVTTKALRQELRPFIEKEAIRVA